MDRKVDISHLDGSVPEYYFAQSCLKLANQLLEVDVDVETKMIDCNKSRGIPAIDS